MECPRCGSQIKDGKLFCEHCGEEIRIVQDYEPEMDGYVAEYEDEKETDREADPRRRLSGRKRKCILAVCLLLLALSFMTVIGYALRYYNAQYQYEKAQEYIGRKNYERALPYAQRAASLDPDNVDHLLCLLNCLNGEESQEETIGLCTRIIQLDGSRQEPYDRLISLYAEKKEYDKINALLEGCKDERIANKYPAYLAKPPEFSYAGGIYNETLALTLLANTKGTIYYTMDGSVPDENAQIYTSPIFLESGKYQVRAVFVNDFGVMSQEAQERYYVDVTVPDPPEVKPESGEYFRPTLVTVETGENCTVYYTTDASAPNQDSTQYTGPFSMPLGSTRFRFISYSAAGVAGEETTVTYTLKLHAALSMEAARNKLLIELMNADVIQDMSGSVKTGSGHNVYNYRYAVTIDDIDYYLYREYYEDDAGNRAGTGTDYVVSIMDGQCFKAVQAKQEEALGTAEDAEGAANPWNSLMLQEINSGEIPEQG